MELTADSSVTGFEGVEIGSTDVDAGDPDGDVEGDEEIEEEVDTSGGDGVGVRAVGSKAEEAGDDVTQDPDGEVANEIASSSFLL